jgi:hypothetical protein
MDSRELGRCLNAGLAIGLLWLILMFWYSTLG